MFVPIHRAVDISPMVNMPILISKNSLITKLRVDRRSIHKLPSTLFYLRQMNGKLVPLFLEREDLAAVSVNAKSEAISVNQSVS
jgi:hypothetical protein